MPKTGDSSERKGNYVDEHGHEAAVKEGDPFPTCPDGETWWWHEDLPVAAHIKWDLNRKAERARRNQSGGTSV